VELRGADEQGARFAIVVVDAQPQELAASESARVEEDDRQAVGPAPQGGVRTVQARDDAQKPADLLGGEDVGLNRLVWRRELREVGDEARGLRPPAVETEIAGDAQPIAADTGGEVHRNCSPSPVST
jgi:hypothetical protein